jgi:hypothetical protein
LIAHLTPESQVLLDPVDEDRVLNFVMDEGMRVRKAEIESYNREDIKKELQK